METKVKYFKNLDGLRFLCFFSVFTVHTLHTSNKQIQSNLFYKVIVEGLFANGGLAVNFFFVLSGFLITYLLIIEKQTTGKINILHFWFKRIIRIWPLYFVCVLFGFGIFPYFKTLFGERLHETADLKLYLLFLGNFDILKHGWPDSTELGVLWSISIEEQFYLVWPVILYLFPVKRYWIVFASILLISLTFRAFNDKNVIYYYHTLSCISDMAIGGLGAWLMEYSLFKKAIINLGRFKIILIYLGFALVFVFREQILMPVYSIRIFERVIISLLMMMIILEQNFSINSFYKMGDFKRISKLGIVTYGMYMLHIICIIIVTIMLKVFKLNENVYFIILIGPIVALVLTILMSKFSYTFFEKKFLKLRDYII